jgi:DNA-directed RNA polymerase specialized sigma24 family protein
MHEPVTSEEGGGRNHSRPPRSTSHERVHAPAKVRVVYRVRVSLDEAERRAEDMQREIESRDESPTRVAPPPELHGLTADELKDLYEDAWAFAYRLTKSKDLAYEITQTSFMLFYTTRRWNPDGPVPLARHVLGIVKSVVSHRRTAKGPKREAEAAATFLSAGGDTARSAEEANLEHAEYERGRAGAESVLEKLRAKLAGNDVALRRLEVMASSVDKPAEQARALKVSVEEVYRAREATQYHLKRILADERGDESESQ